MAKNKKKKQKKNGGRVVLLILLSVLLVALIGLASILGQREVPVLEQSEKPQQSGTEGSGETLAVPEEIPTVPEQAAIELSDGLVIHHISSYAGIYMEDGTNEPVADVMMIVLENTASQDLQLARVNIEYADFIAEFEVTNIPSGEKVVALEKNRQPEASEEYLSIQAKNVVFFPETMGLQEERIQIEGHKGTLEVTNVSDADITEDIYIYYKNSATDLLYGGITYRVAVKGGLKAGESTQIIAGHYAPGSSRLVMVD